MHHKEIHDEVFGLSGRDEKMKEVISNELLSEVLGFEVKGNISVSKAYDYINGDELDWDELCFDGISYPIHYIAHKCKEWATLQGYFINTGNRCDGTNRYDVFCGDASLDYECDCDYLNAIFDTEPEAIFKACQWIHDNKDEQ